MVKEQNYASLETEGSTIHYLPTMKLRITPLTRLIEIVTSRMANTIPFRIGLKN